MEEGIPVFRKKEISRNLHLFRRNSWERKRRKKGIVEAGPFLHLRLFGRSLSRNMDFENFYTNFYIIFTISGKAKNSLDEML